MKPLARTRLYRFQHTLAGTLMLVNAYQLSHQQQAVVAAFLLGLLGVACLFMAVFYEPLAANFPRTNAYGFGLEGLTLLAVVLLGREWPASLMAVGYLLLAAAFIVLSFTLYRHPESS